MLSQKLKRLKQIQEEVNHDFSVSVIRTLIFKKLGHDINISDPYLDYSDRKKINQISFNIEFYYNNLNATISLPNRVVDKEDVEAMVRIVKKRSKEIIEFKKNWDASK